MARACGVRWFLSTGQGAQSLRLITAAQKKAEAGGASAENHHQGGGDVVVVEKSELSLF